MVGYENHLRVVGVLALTIDIVNEYLSFSNSSYHIMDKIFFWRGKRFVTELLYVPFANNLILTAALDISSIASCSHIIFWYVKLAKVSNYSRFVLNSTFS